MLQFSAMVERLTNSESGNGDERPRFNRQLVEIASINTLVQPRKTFDETLPALADSIAQVGLISPLIVDRLDKKGIFPQLEAVNRVWGITYTPEDLIGVEEEGEPVWYLLVAGERRLRASRILLKDGCSSCNEKYGPGGCYERHFGGQQIEASVCTDIPPLEFFRLQASENTHRPVPVQEEAGFYERFFKTLRADNPDYPLSQFARDVGRSPSTIREALRYCTLPGVVQQFVEKGAISYGVATQLARLQEAIKMSDEELAVWAQRAFIERLTVGRAKEIVNRYLEESASSQGMLMLFTPEQEAQQRKRRRRKVIDEDSHLFLRAQSKHWQKTARLLNEGQLDRDDSPFSTESTRRLLEDVIGTHDELLQAERGLIGNPEKRDQLKETLQGDREVMKEIDQQTDVVIFDRTGTTGGH